MSVGRVEMDDGRKQYIQEEETYLGIRKSERICTMLLLGNI